MKGEKIEFASGNIRECSVRLWRCDLDSRRSAPRAEGGVSAAPYGTAAPIASHAADHVEEYTGMPMVVIKKENDNEHIFTTQRPEAQLACVSENSVTDISWHIKEDDDFIVKIGDEADEVTVKQKLEVSPTVLQIRVGPDPCSGTSSLSAGSKTPALLFTDFAQTILRTEDKIYNKKSSGVPSSANFMLNLKRTNKVCKKLRREPTYNSCDSESTSTSSYVKSLNRRGVRSPTKYDHKKAKLRTDTGSQQYECHYSKYVAKKNSYLNDMRKHIGKKIYKCEQCEYSTPHISTLKRHMHIHTGEKSYECSQCEYRASQLPHLKRHMCTHTNEKLYKCELCTYSASELSNLKRHMRTHTGEKPYKCEQCEYSTSRLDQLKTHARIHTGEKPYICEQCGYSASQLGQLKSHMRIHTGLKPYKCEQCGYSASQVAQLKSHMRIHTIDKLYICEQCGYSASNLGEFKSHIRIHIGEEPYKCEQCEYSAYHKSALKRHTRIHMGKKPYKCKQCEYSASRLDALKSHLRIHMK